MNNELIRFSGLLIVGIASIILIPKLADWLSVVFDRLFRKGAKSSQMTPEPTTEPDKVFACRRCGTTTRDGFCDCEPARNWE